MITQNTQGTTRLEDIVKRDKSAFVTVEFRPFKKDGIGYRHWSRTKRKVLVGSNVHRAIEGEQGSYFDFLRGMYRKPR